MPLPDLIEIVPVLEPLEARVTIPGSKSITNRALILAALARGRTVLRGALWSEDTQAMVACLQQVGFEVQVEPDPADTCNRTLTVQGLGGVIPRGGTESAPLDLFVGNAGTAARFLAAFLCLGKGVYRLHGVPRMHQRPQGELFAALRELGYLVQPEGSAGCLPARITGTPPSPGVQPSLVEGRFVGAGARNCSISIQSSSQFASALLLCSRVGFWNVTVVGQNADESPYVAMTVELVKQFPVKGGVFQIEPDASSGSYFVAAAWLLRWAESFSATSDPKGLDAGWTVTVDNWPHSGWQIDQEFPKVLALNTSLAPGLSLARSGHPPDPKLEKQLDRLYSQLPAETVISRQRDLGDSIMMAIVLAPFGVKPIRFTDLGRLRVQECERVVALRTELAKCGAKVIEKNDTLTVYPSELHGAEIETYNDHRMAMCFAILGLKVPGIKLKNPACVKKTFPNFFQKLAVPAPHGLGATIREPGSGRVLGLSDLLAE
jgi:3-phosphoshikimate 1-carboxyvinyltransferase